MIHHDKSVLAIDGYINNWLTHTHIVHKSVHNSHIVVHHPCCGNQREVNSESYCTNCPFPDDMYCHIHSNEIYSTCPLSPLIQCCYTALLGRPSKIRQAFRFECRHGSARLIKGARGDQVRQHVDICRRMCILLKSLVLFQQVSQPEPWDLRHQITNQQEINQNFMPIHHHPPP